MNTLAINFVQRRRNVSSVGIVLFLAGAAAACVTTSIYLDGKAELEHAQARVLRLQRTQTTARRPASSPTVVRDEDKSFSRVGIQLRRPWNALLSDIDLISTPSVALLSVEGQGQTRALRMSGEAKTMADVVDYVNRLRKLPLMESVNLVQHEERQSGPVSVIRFSLDAAWRAPQ